MKLLSDAQRINVIGTSGSGKSTLAKRIAEAKALPYVELDRIFWGPNWYSSTDEELFENLRTEISGDKWILDGNYTRTIPIKWESVDIVVWIDLPFYLTLIQAVKRAFLRSLRQEELWPETGNRESFKKSFFSKDSIILWTIKTYKINKERNEKHMIDERFSHIKFIRLKSRKDINEFLSRL